MNGFSGQLLFDRDASAALPRCFRPIRGGRAGAAFAGQLDDRKNLVASLGLARSEKRTDHEIAARALERWGGEAPSRMLGDYALAAWFGDERQLMLAGDVMGMRTVYYWHSPEAVCFATSLRDLMAMPGVPRVINDLFVADYLAMNYGDDASTFYQGVFKVLSGNYVLLTAEGAEDVRFHRFDSERRIHLPKDQDYVECARELLDAAVVDRMRGETMRSWAVEAWTVSVWP